MVETLLSVSVGSSLVLQLLLMLTSPQLLTTQEPGSYIVILTGILRPALRSLLPKPPKITLADLNLRLPHKTGRICALCTMSSTPSSSDYLSCSLDCIQSLLVIHIVCLMKSRASVVACDGQPVRVAVWALEIGSDFSTPWIAGGPSSICSHCAQHIHRRKRPLPCFPSSRV